MEGLGAGEANYPNTHERGSVHRRQRREQHKDCGKPPGRHAVPAPPASRHVAATHQEPASTHVAAKRARQNLLRPDDDGTGKQRRYADQEL